MSSTPQPARAPAAVSASARPDAAPKEPGAVVVARSLVALGVDLAQLAGLEIGAAGNPENAADLAEIAERIAARLSYLSRQVTRLAVLARHRAQNAAKTTTQPKPAETTASTSPAAPPAESAAPPPAAA
jgi:hypothetical protein